MTHIPSARSLTQAAALQVKGAQRKPGVEVSFLRTRQSYLAEISGVTC